MHPELCALKNKRYYTEFLLQDCYVHLGDIYRYTAVADNPKLKKTYLQQAQLYYKEASSIDKSKGQPYNQMAILYCSKAEFFHVIFYWCKALDAKYPFQPAQQNLTKQLEKCLGRPLLDVASSLASTKNSLPNKRIEDAKKYFLRSFARAYLSKVNKMDHCLSLQDFLEVNKLFAKVTIRSKNLGWFYLKVSYLYIWLHCSNNITEQNKKMLIDALENFLVIMITGRTELEVDRLMPAIRLVIEWLDKNEKTETMENLANTFYHRFNTNDNANLYAGNLRIALSEGEEILGMSSFEKVSKSLVYEKYTDVNTVQAEKCIIYWYLGFY